MQLKSQKEQELTVGVGGRPNELFMMKGSPNT